MSFNSTVGATVVGILIAGVLFGLFAAQVYIFRKTISEESSWIRFGLVDGMCLGMQKRSSSQPPLPFLPLFLSRGNNPQGYFTYRIYRFGGRPYIIPTFSCLFTICQFSFDIVVAVKAAEKSIGNYLQQTEGLILTPLVLRGMKFNDC
ncbi:hypothetical protein BT96DRAFT_990484 [Gymnopus androsaceus JB14]|uniref:Uncharacterized protein n=1 Tax=Gymnopus androsaceus JB14 TaxID=1447944 RepID=A0A6A4HYE0_9AGAR|nr:hypothetical protein BT96DRAFT_990484 [Gymnopus androsaceus JB14]